MWIVLGAGALLFVGVMLCLGTGIIGYNLKLLLEEQGKPAVTEVVVIEPTEVQVTALPPTNQADDEDPGINSWTLEVLQNEVIPINDPIALVERLEGKSNLPRTQPVEDLSREVGEMDKFWVTNVDTAENFQIEARLAAVTDHLYFWIEDGVEYSEKSLNRLAAEFENKIYPTNQAFFGPEWSPGVDEDPHLYVIYASGLGDSLAGYYASIDEYPPEVHEYSNAHETFMLNADNLNLGDNYTYNVLAHEFQHMIHWYRDRNETSWLNEGFSELATLLNGYLTHRGGFDYLYAQDPDLQLNDWPNDPSRTRPHYGSSFLFVTYFLDRFGNDATKALVADDLNGLPSLDRVLANLEIENPVTGGVMTADDVFMDWVVTNYLKDEYQLSERFIYSNYPNAPQFSATEEISECPTALQSRDVSQYGVDYIRLSCGGEYRLTFDGQDQVKLIPEDPYSGTHAFWSNKGDQSNMTLTREFDFTDHNGPLTLQYWTWYDIEEDYDYLYLEASINGRDWVILRTPSGTSEDPSGNSYGYGYNGLSGENGEWILEEVDLSAYAGQKVQIRFEYVTDAAVHGEGFLVDDLAIPEIGYQTDFEQDAGGWDGAGFVRIENELPQFYRLAVLHLGEQPAVEYLTLEPGNQLDYSLSIGGEGGTGEVILVVTGTTRFTRQKALYDFQVILE